MNNTASYTGNLFNGQQTMSVNDVLAVEVALTISVNDVPFTITMQQPGNERILARGILFTEKIIQDTNVDIQYKVRQKDNRGYITHIDVQVAPEYILRDFSGTRNVISSASCGMCGKTAFDQEPINAVKRNVILPPTSVSAMFDKVAVAQQSFISTGGTHAAGAFDSMGNMLCMHEDIGRHNAVDKVIGDLLQQQLLDRAVCLTVSGRISYEIVSKALEANIQFVASVSAPSSLAVETAQAAGITLMAFCRSPKLTIYSHPEFISHSQLQPLNH